MVPWHPDGEQLKGGSVGQRLGRTPHLHQRRLRVRAADQYPLPARHHLHVRVRPSLRTGGGQVRLTTAGDRKLPGPGTHPIPPSRADARESEVVGLDEVVELCVRGTLGGDQAIVSSRLRAHELIKLALRHQLLAVLCVLDDEHHHHGDGRRR